VGNGNAGGLHCEDSNPIVSNCIFWNNNQFQINSSGISNPYVTFSNVEYGYTGIGNIHEDPLFTSGPSGDFYLSQVEAGQIEQSPCVDAGDPSSTLIFGTTRTDEMPDWGIIDMGWHYKSSLENPAIDIQLTYISGSPVPAWGGNLYFDVLVANADTLPIIFDAWIDISYVGGQPTKVAQRFLENFQPGWIINRTNMIFPIPGSYAGGTYSFAGKVGDYPDIVWDESSFPFVKFGVIDNHDFIPFVPEGWINPFEDFIGSEPESDAPDGEVILGCHPNPFNSTVNIHFEQSEAGHVSITIYDVMGRKIAQLIDSWMDASHHHVTWDASSYPAGICIYQLKTGGYTTSGKLLHLK
jgi:hypothetical protein